MDTTAIEYELKQLREQVDALLEHHYVHDGVDLKLKPKPTMPRFWKRWTSPHQIKNNGKLAAIIETYDPENGQWEIPVYCFTREMLIDLARHLDDITHCDYALMIDSYLKSNGGI